jgi:hypothetical protein
MEETKMLLELDLSIASKELIEVLIEDPPDPSLFEEIARSNMNRPEILRLLIENPNTPEEVREHAGKAFQMPVKPISEIVKAQEAPEARTQTILQKIQRLTIPERRQLALKGGREIRSILIKDPYKEVVLTVLENAKITDTEVEIIARSRSIPDEALRKITKKREWIKNYAIVLAVVTNPKTPSGMAVTLINELKTKDLSLLEKNKNIPEAVRSAAKRLLKMKKGY